MKSTTCRTAARVSVALALMNYGPLLAHAQMVTFGDSYQYDNGVHPSVALWDTVVVEVHQAPPTDLWYRVGQLNGSTIQWGDSYWYDTGLNPSICTSYDYWNQALRVVEMHDAGDGSVWSHVGQVDGPGLTIQWAPRDKFGINRAYPHCALWGLGVVSVMNNLWSQGSVNDVVGAIRGPDFLYIDWWRDYAYDNGQNPSVATWNGDAVEVHQGGNGVGPLWTRAGQVIGYSIQWGGSSQYDNGENPSVALSFGSPERVVEVHQAGDGVGALWSRAGTLSGSTVQWGDSALYDYGVNPSVALYGGRAVEIHDGGDGSLWYRVGTWWP